MVIAGPLCRSVARQYPAAHRRKRGRIVECNLTILFPHAQLSPERIQIGRPAVFAHLCMNFGKH